MWSYRAQIVSDCGYRVWAIGSRCQLPRTKVKSPTATGISIYVLLSKYWHLQPEQEALNTQDKPNKSSPARPLTRIYIYIYILVTKEPIYFDFVMTLPSFFIFIKLSNFFSQDSDTFFFLTRSMLLSGVSFVHNFSLIIVICILFGSGLKISKKLDATKKKKKCFACGHFARNSKNYLELWVFGLELLYLLVNYPI